MIEKTGTTGSATGGNGALATAMANAPLASESSAVIALAGNDMKAALKDAAIKSSRRSAARISQAVQHSVFDDLFGDPQFVLEASPREYDDKRIAGKKSSAVAQCVFRMGGKPIEFSATIYKKTQIGKDDTGSYTDTWHEFSLPRNSVTIPKNEPELTVIFGAWKERMREKYETFRTAVDASAQVGAPKLAVGLIPRHVKRERAAA